MGAMILDGKPVAAAAKAEVASAIKKMSKPPGLATVLVGDDPASHTYVRGKRRDVEEVGMVSIHHHLPASVSQRAIEDLIGELNVDVAVDGILVQLPLPAGLNSQAVVERLDPAKDADGLHPINLGKIILDLPGPRPCTPSGVIRILEHYRISVAGKRTVVVGRSFLVGRPLALLLSAKGVDATVTIAHSRTPHLASVTREADIVVAAAGVPGLIKAEHIRPGATVIDVGITRVGDHLVGDVDFLDVVAVAGAITPVPGGVGPMTRAMLLANTLALAQNFRSGA
ncbi:MAG: bifunctional methylenetetrahydrofolate dehydrogenase/methenyltetrahydrofolate cyclohydrolase FolD [Acidimicrobiia bacterium]